MTVLLLSAGSRSTRAGPPGRDQAEQEGGQHGDAEGEGQDMGIEAHRQPGARHDQAEQEAQDPARHEQAERAPEQRQEQALREQLPHQAATAGAEGEADRDLPLPARGAGQEQVADVGAGDQQHQADDRHQDRQRPRVPFPQSREALGEGGEVGRQPLDLAACRGG